MTEPLWLRLGELRDIHAEQRAIFGGGDGRRDEGLLESALMRPQHQWHYGVEDLARLAAAYAFGLSKHLPSVDGSKRVAFAALMCSSASTVCCSGRSRPMRRRSCWRSPPVESTRPVRHDGSGTTGRPDEAPPDLHGSGCIRYI